ncbi:MAG: Arc/MetJ family transcription regulator [Rhodothermales bacterium]|jgi:Arc/MetJ family transcription regulator
MCMIPASDTHSKVMRTNIVIDDALMSRVLKITGLKTKREAVDLGLKTIVRLNQQADIKDLRGKLEWDGDLDEMRTDS